MRLGSDERALLARTVAALRRNGWPAPAAISAVAGSVSDGATRRAFERIAASLARGETPEEGEDPLVALLARGDAAGADALEEEARAVDIAREARQTAWSGILYPAVMLVTAGFLLVVLERTARQFGSMLSFGYSGFGAALPRATALALDIAPAFPYLAVLCFATVALLALFARSATRFVPGVRGLLAASRLRSHAAAVFGGAQPREADIYANRALRLDRYEAALGRRVRAVAGEAPAATRLAFELEIAARRAALFARRWLPLLFLGGAFVFGSFFLAAFYLPIFTMMNKLN